VDSGLRVLRGDPRFERMAGPVAVADRVEGIRADLSFLKDEIHRVHASATASVPASIDTGIDSLIAASPRLSFDQLAVELQRVLSRLNDGHTSVIIEGIPTWTRQLPLQFEAFADSIVIAA